jgi:nucleotide-binding universal stress UspA family protein
MNVLVAIDDLAYGGAIVSFLQNHSWSKDTAFRFLHACEYVRFDELPVIAYGVDGPSDLAAMRRADAQDLLDVLAAMLKEEVDRKIETVVVFGKAKDAILEEADSWPADLLVLGSHGRSAVGRLFLGSVSLAVVAQASCSAVIVHLPKSAKVHKQVEESETVRK